MAHRVAQNDHDAPTILPGIHGVGGRFGSVLKVSSGHELDLSRGLAATEIYIVMSGLCLSEWRPTPGRRRVLELFCPTDIIQPIALPALPGLKLVAVTETEIFRLKLAAIERASGQDGELFKALIARFAKTNRMRTILISSLGGLSAEQRVATLFVELSSRLKMQESNCSGFQMPLSRQDIADYLALNPDTLSRIITRYKSNGIFHQIGRDKIYIKDWQELLKQCPVSSTLVAEYQP